MCLAIPGLILSIDDDAHLATVEVMGVRRRVNIDLLRDAPPAEGDWVLIHVGFAMSAISAARADEQLRLLSMLGGDEDAREEAEGYSLDATNGGSS